jgi:hypothetical protein
LVREISSRPYKDREEKIGNMRDREGFLPPLKTGGKNLPTSGGRMKQI